MFKGLFSLYTVRFPQIVLAAWYAHDRSVGAYLKWFWTSKEYDINHVANSNVPDISLFLLRTAMFLQVIVSLGLVYAGVFRSVAGGISFGLALYVIYPVFWAHALVLPHVIVRLCSSVLRPKTAGRAIVCHILESQVRDLRKQHEFKVVAVVGSVGKTSTKLAIANLLGESLRVRYQVGNYNDRVTVPLIFFDQPLPSLLNVVAWCKIFISNRRQIHQEYPYDVVVAELGTDGPGQLRHFAYLHPDLTVVTAVEEEHMEYFKTIDAVAAEELSVFDFSEKVLINIDHVAENYLEGRQYKTYGAHRGADYRLTSRHPLGIEGAKIHVQLIGGDEIESTISLLGKQGSLIALAAAAVASLLGVKKKTIASGLSSLESFAGRMRVLTGLQESSIIDDSYNASPVAVKAGLDVLYALPARQRIAILGNMNELGDGSIAAHREVGEHCEPNRLDLVVTIGPDANEILAPAAAKNGCTVQKFDSPYAAGKFVAEKLAPDTIVLVEGSQNRVFAEEATKQLLANTDDSQKLVRQSAYWKRIKRQQFTDAD